MTHVLVNPRFHALMSGVLAEDPDVFTPRYDDGRWALYEVAPRYPRAAPVICRRDGGSLAQAIVTVVLLTMLARSLDLPALRALFARLPLAFYLASAGGGARRTGGVCVAVAAAAARRRCARAVSRTSFDSTSSASS